MTHEWLESVRPSLHKLLDSLIDQQLGQSPEVTGFDFNTVRIATSGGSQTSAVIRSENKSSHELEFACDLDLTIFGADDQHRVEVVPGEGHRLVSRRTTT